MQTTANLSKCWLIAWSGKIRSFVNFLNEFSVLDDNPGRAQPICECHAGTRYVGKLGVEKTYEEVLHGTLGYSNVETNARGRVLRVLEEDNPISCRDLRLHLDIRLRSLAMKLLDGRRGAIVAIEPATSGIMALASTPSFDPNPFATGIAKDSYQLSLDLPLFNRALRGQYPAGMTIKPMVAIAGLDRNSVTQQKKMWDPGFFRIPGNSRMYRNWKREGQGWMNLRESIAQLDGAPRYAGSNASYRIAGQSGAAQVFSLAKD